MGTTKQRRRDKSGRHGKGAAESSSMLAFQIVKAALEPEVTVGELAKLAQSDPAFAVRLLSVVNSAAYSLVSPIDDVPRAAAMLGIAGMKSLALGMSVVGRTPPGEIGATLLGLCLRRAIAARLIAEGLGMKGQTDDCFTAGLLCEFGLLAHASQDLSVAGEIANAPAGTRIVQERAAELTPHPRRGAELCRKWQLGDNLVGAIEHHHDPSLPSEPVWKVCWAAERIAAVFESADVEGTKATAIDALSQLDLPAAFYDDIMAALPEQVRDAARGYDRTVDQVDADALLLDANARLVDLNRSFHATLRRLEALLADKDALTAKLKRANRELGRMASTDGLTRLLNRRAFNEALGRDLHRASRANEPLSLVMVDVDHFKSFNDTYGHQAGDAVLQSVGKLLADCVREGDVAARYGGEEFTLILPRTAATDAELVANRVRKRLAESVVDIGGRTVRVTASFGVATVAGPRCHELAEGLIAAADAALYGAKEAGRNCVQSAAAEVVPQADEAPPALSHAS
jgi:diguanylate cyclase (GGDEF)-like protein